ncbi:Gfo/Idh/MocA family oxidoreductase [Candidatus Woesearchaeota archaeon]|nr:Gfo/Idh/MocA family oxidoreductase [Candidatus Woesearchaeota archaeon]
MIKIGVIGTGKWGINHLRIYKQLEREKLCELVGLADLDENKKSIADEHKIKYFKNYKDMLAEVDAVSVVVPTDMHYSIVKECLNSNKHVLVEKPITLDSKQAKELVQIAKEKKLVLSVGYLFRFNPAVIELKRLLKSGETGKIQYITARYTHSSKPPRKDSGVIFNLGIHLIDILNFTLEERPKRVYCKKTTYLNNIHEDCANILLDYGNFYADLEVSCCHPLKKRDMWVIAAKEKVYIDFLEQIMIRYPLEITEKLVLAEKEKNIEIRKNEPLKAQLTHFIDCAQNYKEQNQDIKEEIKKIINIGEEEYYTTKICELAIESAKIRTDLELR